MSKLPTTGLPHSVGSSDIHAGSWEHAIEAAISALRDIDARYERDRARVEKLANCAQTRTRLLDELKRRHRKDREPYVLHLADVHQRRMTVALTRLVH